MIKKLAKFIVGFLFCCYSCKVVEKDSSQKILEWSNPIRSEINSYGIKDVFIFSEKNDYFLVGTVYKNPFKKFEGPVLYQSKNVKDWKVKHQIIDINSVPKNAWYYDGWFAPEIKKINNKFYFTFNNRNNAENAYQKTGFGIAVSNSLFGEYKVINTKAPIVKCNHGSLTAVNKNEVFLTYDMDGRIFIAEIDLESATLKSKPKELLGPKTLGKNYKYLDAPQITKVNDVYHMLFSQFYGGYVVKVFHMTAKHPLGTWKWSKNNPIYTFLEAEADLKVKNTYPEKNGYAPPTQVIFSNQIFKGFHGNYFNAYHSSEKYSEPYLCIDPVSINGEHLTVINPKGTSQKLNFND